MKKSTPTPKDIAKKRLAKHPIMKIPLHEQNNITNKENLRPEIKLRKSTFRKKDRVTENFSSRNPFDIPQKERIFSKCKKSKKRIPQPFIMSDVHTICDVDNTFYKIIEGRPLRRFDDIKVYMRNIRDTFLFRANAAYIRDQIIQIDTSYAFEINEYNKIVGLFKRCKDAFVQFAKFSYHNSKKLQMIAEVRALELEKKSEELEIICDEYVKLRNKLADINLTFENLSRYRHFLNQLTPIWWITENVGTSENFFAAASAKSSLLPQMSFRSGGSLEINKSTNIGLNKVESKPYFVEPIQILNTFEDKRRQCLNYLDIAIYSGNILSSVLKARDSLKAQVEEEAKEFQSYIDIYDSLIKFEEEKEASYINVFDKILMNEFQNLFASFDSSKLFTCIQYVNTKIFGDMEDPKDNISTLMFNIENHYMELSLNLDSLDVEIVKRATKQAFDEDKKSMTRAFKAQRMIKECDILSKSLYASFEPSRMYKKNITDKKSY